MKKSLIIIALALLAGLIVFGLRRGEPVATNVSGGNTPYMPTDLLPNGSGFISFQAAGQYPPPPAMNFSTWAGLQAVPCLVAKIT